jgi:hypothetical protein
MRMAPVLLLTQALMVAALAGAAKPIQLIGITEPAAMVRARVVRVRLEGVMPKVKSGAAAPLSTRLDRQAGLDH